MVPLLAWFFRRSSLNVWGYKNVINLKRLAVVVLVVVVIFSLVWWVVGGRQWADRLLTHLLVEGGDRFVVPNARIPLAMAVTQEADEIRVCNQGAASWTNPRVRINGEYLTELKSIRQGDCASIRKTSFHSADWKHLPAPRGLRVTQVEVLSQASGLGYAKQEIPQSTYNR